MNMLNAELKVSFSLSNSNSLEFSIKDSPYRPKQIGNGRLIITGNNHTPVKFTGVLKLLKLEEPELEPIEISLMKKTVPTRFLRIFVLGEKLS